jgi:hypothetical protein
LFERRIGGLSDYFFIIMLAFFAGPEKTPAKMDGMPLVPFQNEAEYVLFVEKKLQGECLVVHLIGLLAWEFSDFHGIGNDDSCLGVCFKGNLFDGAGVGGEQIEQGWKQTDYEEGLFDLEESAFMGHRGENRNGSDPGF